MPPTSAEAEHEELGKTLVRAMISAAKADGQIDAEEKDAIFKRLETMPLSPAEKAFVFDELASPLDIDAVVARADTPEHAAEIYAASLVAMVRHPNRARLSRGAGLQAEARPGPRRRNPPRPPASRSPAPPASREVYAPQQRLGTRRYHPCAVLRREAEPPSRSLNQESDPPWKSASTRSPRTPPTR